MAATCPITFAFITKLCIVVLILAILLSVQPPLPGMVIQIEKHLSVLRTIRKAGQPGSWWRPSHVVSRVADALNDISFCILDDFLPMVLADELAGSIRASRPSGHIAAEGKNGWTRGATARTAEAINAEGNFEMRNELLARSLMNPSRGDVLKFSEIPHGAHMGPI